MVFRSLLTYTTSSWSYKAYEKPSGSVAHNKLLSCSYMSSRLVNGSGLARYKGSLSGLRSSEFSLFAAAMDATGYSRSGSSSANRGTNRPLVVNSHFCVACCKSLQPCPRQLRNLLYLSVDAEKLTAELSFTPEFQSQKMVRNHREQIATWLQVG